MNGATVSTLILLTAVLGSALGVVYAKHSSRTLFVELRDAEQEIDRLNVEWGQLQLEQSTLANHGRIEGVAARELKMYVPDFRDIVMVRP
jgi:cell division protein FtsL